MIKSRENAKKPVFPAYFQPFRPEKFFFQKSGSVTFWTLSFCVSVQNFMKKYQVQLEIFKKYCFSGENWLFRRFLESSGFKNKFFWQLKHAWWWVLLLIMFLCEKITKYEEKPQTKSAKTAISGIFPAFSAGKKFFYKIGLGHVLGIANTHLCAKNQKKLMMKSRENAKKPVFPAYFRHFRPEKYFFWKSGSVKF